MRAAGISEGSQDVGVVQLTADEGLQCWTHLWGQGGVCDLQFTHTKWASHVAVPLSHQKAGC